MSTITNQVVMSTPQSQAIVDTLIKFGFLYRSGFGDEVDTKEKFFTRVYLPGKIFEVLYDFKLGFFSLEEIQFDYIPGEGHKESRIEVLAFVVGSNDPDNLVPIIGARYDILEGIYADLSAKLNLLRLVSS